MKLFVALLCLAPLALHAHTTDSSGLPMDKEMLRKHIADEFMAKRMALAKATYKPMPKPVVTKEVQLASMMTNLSMLAQGSTLTAPGNGELMSASFSPFKPKLRFYNDANYFYVESDGIPDRTRQPNLMVGITTWQQQVPMPVSYFIGTTNGTNNAGSLGFGQPNVWKLPLVPVPAASPISLNGNFLRGAVALGSDGVPIFNPRNNTGQFSYDIGELDIYGGHCGLADDYHYHIYPVHLIPVLGNDKPIAWALDGYPVYGYVEPDGSPMQTLDADGGHDHGTWGYHYHARGTYNSGTASWTPTNPFMMNAMHGVVVNFDSQIDPQPNVSNMRASGTGGYTAQQVPGAAITAFKNPVALSVDGSGHFIENVSGTPSEDDFLMRYTVSSVTYDVCWRLNRKAVPKSYTMTYRHPTTGTTTTTYTSNGNRVTTYPMSGKSMIALPDTSQTGNFTGSAGDGEDSDYTINAQAFTNNGNGTITDNVTGLMWQSVDHGESTWENAVANAASVTTGGYNDWRLPTPHELFCLFNHQVSNPALNTAFFPNNPVARAGYWWSSDLYGTSTTNVWCTNEGGGLGPKPKSETISAGGTLRYHARYVRGAKQTNGHNYVSNNDGTVTDLDTGLMWRQVPRTAATWSAALADIEGLTDAGFSDWRMPNVKEMESLVDYTMTTFTSLTNIKPPAHRLLFPSAMATSYWTSTTQNNDALAALVVEFGLNTTSNPPRNAQGIISHEPKTSSYPVFAVRTAALTPTQIAVSQGATTLTDGLSTVGYGSVNVGNTLSKTFTITNSGTTALTGISLSIDGAHSSLFTVTTSPASSIAIGATSDFVVQFNASSAGAKTAALHIASSDSSVGAAFDIALTGTGNVPPPTIANITVNPISPASTDTVTITAQVTPGHGATISGVNLSYDLGEQTTGPAFREIFANTSGNGLTGTMNPWTVTATRNAADVRQRGGASNRTVPIVLTNCTTNGTTSVSCASTAGLIPGMLITGTSIAANTTISQVNSSTAITLSQAAGSGSSLSLTAAGVTLTSCTLGTVPTINTASTTGLAAGMGLTGSGLATNPPNPTVAAVTNGTSFTTNSTTITTVPATLTASGMALEFNNGTTSFDATMAQATNVIDAGTATAGNVEFYARNSDLSTGNGWTLQISPDGGTTWNTRMSETFASSSATCTLNGTTTIACTDTRKLTVGNTIQGAAGTIANCVTSATTNPTVVLTTNTSGLAVGMFITGANGTGIPNGARITAINPGVSFTLNAGVTVTNATPGITLLANYLANNATISSITPNVSFVVSSAPFYSGSATLASLNHGFKLFRYDLVAGDMTANMKMRFQFSGNTAASPARPPSTNIDDITVTLTTGAPPTVIAMTDLGGGLWSAAIPAQANGSTVNFAIAATGTAGGTTTSSSMSYTVAPAPTITTATPLPNGTTTGAYSQTLAATGGSGTGYVWSLFSGSLPNGITLSSGGVLSGTATQAGTFNFTAKVTDSATRSATKAIALTITTVTAPNVVIIVTDDQGWGDVGYHTPAGQVPIQTPNMDSFATTGIRLERFYATTVCSVTRSTLMTGRNAIRHGTNNERGLDLSEHLMPQTFKAAGYQTFMCGKWHLGGSDKNIYHFNVNGSPVRVIKEGLQYAPHNRGWDSFYGQYSGAIDYYTHNSAEAESLDVPDWWLNGVQQDGASEHTDSRGYGGWSPTLLADKAIAHIQNRNPAQPMLLHLAFNSIHGPVSAPASLITKYQNLGVTNANRRLISAAVDGMDQEIGRVLAALDTAGIANNTLVIWFGDNGGDETKGSLNDPLRGTKGDSYEGGMREVAGIKWPGVLPAGVISNQYMWVGDVFPTLCAAVGVTPQNTKPLDGVNLWPALLSASNSTTVSRGSPLVTVSAAPIAIFQFTDPVNGGTKDFKLIRGRVNNVLTPELYNLTDDPQETTDLIANSAYASIVTTLTNAITAISVENMKPYVGPPLITNAVPQGSAITLYAPFTSWPGAAPTVQWRKGGSNVAGGVVTQITDDLAVTVRGTYAATLTLTNVAPSDAGLYDVIVSNNIGSTTSDAGTLTVTMGAPQLTLPAYTKGTSITMTWPAVASATGYTIQRSATADFATILGTQTTSSTSVTFSGLTSGTTYYYRGTATDGTSTSAFGSTASSTQDAGNPVVTITSPANNTTTTANSIVVTGTASDTISSLTAVVVNGVNAVSSDNYATWTATVPLTPGANTITATSTDSADQGGNTGTASVSVTYNASGPTIVRVVTGPTAPTYLDHTYVLAQITPRPGTTLSSVQLQYDTGIPVSTTVWRETFANTSSNNWNGTGALNVWTTAGGGVVRQAVSTSNRTSISITNAATTSGSTSVTCSSTANLWPGMLITGPNIPGSIIGTQTGNTTVASITNATTFVLSQAATSDGSSLTLTACGVTLTNCTTNATTTVTCDSTAGLVNGMSLIGTGLANNATVASVTSATSFTMNVAPTTPGGPLTLSASTAAAEFNSGTANLTDSMFTTTNAINTSGASGFIEFYVQTRDLAANNNCGWTMQVSADNGATWNTRLFEDWNSETVNLTNVITNAAGAAAGSTTVTCASTTGLTTGRSISGPNVYVTCGLTSGQSSVTCTNITGLLPGMALQGTGIPNNTRIGVITPGVSPAGSFTLVTGTTATAVNATVTNAATAVAATYFPTATVTSITNGTTFVINTPAYVNTSAAPIAASATTVNHGFQLFHYDFVSAELGTQTKIRFQAAGYTPTSPTRSPRISIDDIIIATTAPPPIITLTMFDDGLHGDSAANDGLWGALIPAYAGGTTIDFRVIATDSSSASTTSPGSGYYLYTVNSSLTDATVRGAEFLGMPTSSSVTLNIIFTANQEMFVEYGTLPGKYTVATAPLVYNIDNTKPEFANPAEVTITGLQPDTEYYYRVRHRNIGAAFFNARGERAFHTARPRGTTFSFTVTADPHIDVNTDMQLFWRAMQNISIDNPDIHMDVGDIFMTDKLADGLLGVPPKWGGGVTINQTNVNNRAIIFRNAFERACHSIPFFFGLGNHEAEYGYLFNAAADKQNNIPAWDLKARKAFYPTPVPDSFYTGNATPKDYTGGTLGLLEDYYAFEWGEALFITLDPFWNVTTNPNSANDAWHWTLGKAQYDWLRDTLKNSSARYKFVFMHHIVGGSTQTAAGVPQFAARGGVEVSDKYEWGGNNADGSPGFATKRPGWDLPIHNLLVQNKVNVVFHGHDHLYGYQTKDGMVYLECPQPGTPNYTSLGSAADGQYIDLASDDDVLLPNSGHIRITVGPDQAVADYVRSYRTASDPMPPDATSVFNDETPTRINRSVSHSFVLAPKISPPIEVANLAPGQVGLRWNAIPNKPYQIQWSTDLVNWQTIETLTFTNTNTNATYTDSLPARVNGQRAFYRVSYTP
jgi:arylsulfatase A-like enzyme